MGDPHESALPASRFRPAVAALRENALTRGTAALPAARLEGLLRAAGDRLRAVLVPRQYRRGADRRGDGAHAVPREGSYWLSRRDRRGVERRRLRQRQIGR